MRAYDGRLAHPENVSGPREVAPSPGPGEEGESARSASPSAEPFPSQPSNCSEAPSSLGAGLPEITPSDVDQDAALQAQAKRLAASGLDALLVKYRREREAPATSPRYEIDRYQNLRSQRSRRC
jgi:hypothetical protein